MDYKGEWGEGALDTPGPLNGTREASAICPYCCVGPILLCCIVMEISTGWGRFFWGGGGRFDPTLAVR